MALDVAAIAELAAKFLDELDEDTGEDAELVRFAIVVELHEDEADVVHVRTPDDQGNTEAAGLLARGLDVVVDPTD